MALRTPTFPVVNGSVGTRNKKLRLATENRIPITDILEFNFYMLESFREYPDILFYRENGIIHGYRDKDIYFSYVEPEV